MINDFCHGHYFLDVSIVRTVIEFLMSAQMLYKSASYHL